MTDREKRAVAALAAMAAQFLESSESVLLADRRAAGRDALASLAEYALIETQSHNGKLVSGRWFQSGFAWQREQSFPDAHVADGSEAAMLHREERLMSALIAMVRECLLIYEGAVDSGALRAGMLALSVLAERGLFVVEFEYGRRIVGHWSDAGRAAV